MPISLLRDIMKAADEAYLMTDGLLEAYGTAGFEKGAKAMRDGKISVTPKNTI